MTTRRASQSGLTFRCPGLLLGVVAALALSSASAVAQPSGNDFARQVDLTGLGRVAVHAEGRLKSFDSFATSIMRYVSGPRRINDQSPTFSYMDLMLRPQRYADAALIYVKKKPMRAQIIRVLEGSAAASLPDFSTRMDRFLEEGLISEQLLLTSEVRGLLQQLNTDLIRTARYVSMIDSALTVKDPQFLLGSWRVIPPTQGDFDTPWIGFDQILSTPAGSPAIDVTPEVRQQLLEAWEGLVSAWLGEDAAGVTAAGDQLATILSTINPGLYPEQRRLAFESFYFRAYNLTWIWIFYALSLVPLLLNLVFRWPAARWIGLGLFLLAFGLHTAALLLRWYVSARWPNSNMFEAVTTSAWFGGCAALVMEVLVRRTRMRNLFALTSAVASMVALMCAYYLPLSLDAGIENRMPVLHDVWLYIHTNVIIWSYCLIFMAAVSAVLYLIFRARKWLAGESGQDDFARVGGAGSLILSPAGRAGKAHASAGHVLDGSTMVLMELSFIMLWAGLVMGAIWADHSWGRPWGWDPKEVFALNTFLVFAVLIHVRLKTADKGLWTAVIALFGAGVMLFNWIAINFVITGLHSYA